MKELELQAHWFASDFGREFRTTAGDAVRIVQFGVWNREAGPDFADNAGRTDHCYTDDGSAPSMMPSKPVSTPSIVITRRTHASIPAANESRESES